MRSIFAKFMIPTVLIMCILTFTILGITQNLSEESFEKQIITQNNDTSNFIAQSVEGFMDKAYHISEELANLDVIFTMETDIQTPVVKSVAERNDYFELIYVQDMKGNQTCRSSGALGNRANRWWFIQMMEQKTAFISKSYYSVSTDMTCASVFIPMMKDEEMVGIFATDIKLASLNSLVEEFSDVKNGKTAFIIDGEGAVVAHAESVYYEELYNYKNLTKTVTKKTADGETEYDADGNIVTEDIPIKISEEYADIIQAVMEGKKGDTTITENGKEYYASYTPIKLAGNSDSWSVITLQDKEMALSVFERVQEADILIAVIVITIAVILMALIAHTITKPIKNCLVRLKQLSEGDLTTKVPVTSGKDEVAQLQNALGKTIEDLRDMLHEITMFVAKVEEGDYTQRMSKNFSGDFNLLAQSIFSVSSSVRKTLIEINNHCKVLAKEVSFMDAEARQLSDGTHNQASAIEEISATLTDISEKVAMNAKRSKESDSKMDIVQNSAVDSSTNLETLSRAMIAIEENSNEINNISRLIQKIASQTNLLSMNASVEAARAGEAGKGFDVVAAEIRHLAEECTSAASSTTELVAQTCKNIKQGMKALALTEQSIECVTVESENTSRYLHDITYVSEEQSESITQIADAVDQISGVTQMNAEDAAESAKISNQMKEQISELERILSKYKYH